MNSIVSIAASARLPDGGNDMKWALALNRLLLILAAASALSGCDAKSRVGSPYKVIDTGYWNAGVNSLTEPLWLDNERILFPSTESLAPGKRPYHVKVLNTITGKLVSTHFHLAMCVRDGVAVFREKNESGKWIEYRGTPESYREELGSRRHLGQYSPGQMFDMNFDCGWVPVRNYNDKPLPHRFKLHGENYTEVLEKRTKRFEYQKRPVDRKREQETGEHLGPEGKVFYHRDENDPGRIMPSGGISYSEFLGAYVVGHGYYSPKWPETRSFSILQRNGDLQEIPYPKTLHEGQLELYPIKLGYLVKYHSDPIPGTDPFNKALYLMQGEQMRRLITGSIHHVSISPDGCKAAFIHAKNIKEDISTQKPHRTVKLINFCQGVSTP